IVMVILGLLAALVGPRMFGKVGKSRQNAAKVQIALFETALDTYRLDTSKYPKTLQALRVDPGDVKRWDGPYLPKPVPMDPWGNPYIYKLGEKGEYELISLGSDGAEGGEGEDADISNIGEGKDSDNR
ncbi:MAG: type II secretion system major pseudopilin GspG, partial [Pseudomonadota bacterium]